MVVKQFKESVAGVGDVVYDIQNNFVGFVKVLPKRSNTSRLAVGLLVIAGVFYLLHYYWRVF